MPRVERGKLGAAKRWGPDGRLIRLSDLDVITREIVLAILHARANAKADGGSTP